MWSRSFSTCTARLYMFVKRSSTTGTWWTSCGEAGAIFVEELERSSRGRAGDFQRARRIPGGPAGGQERKLDVIDATCPLVTKVHLEAVKFAREDYTIVLIGHKDHDEVIGTLGEAPQSTILVSSVEDVDRLEVKDPSRVPISRKPPSAWMRPRTSWRA